MHRVCMRLFHSSSTKLPLTRVTREETARILTMNCELKSELKPAATAILCPERLLDTVHMRAAMPVSISDTFFCLKPKSKFLAR